MAHIQVRHEIKSHGFMVDLIMYRDNHHVLYTHCLECLITLIVIIDIV